MNNGKVVLMLFDSHAHYDDERFNEDRDIVLKSVYESGVGYVLNAASDVASIDSTLELSEKYDFVYAAIGIHPHNVEKAETGVLDRIAELSKRPKVVAIGEIGLDYYYDFSPRELQKKWLIMQIGLAKDLKLPIIVHNRDSHQDILDIVKSENAKKTGGVFHMFSGSVEMAEILLDNNFYISVGGVVTFNNAKKIVDVVKAVPPDRLLVETDCPYMTPVPFRGRRNDSTYMINTVRKIAEIKGMEVERIIEITTKNAKDLFNIK